MAYYLFNLLGGNARREAAVRLRAGRWAIAADERFRDDLAPGDLVLVYAAAPVRSFMGCSELASPVEAWNEPAAAGANRTSGVALSHVEVWNHP
jgi:hypothetical protein